MKAERTVETDKIFLHRSNWELGWRKKWSRCCHGETSQQHNLNGTKSMAIYLCMDSPLLSKISRKPTCQSLTRVAAEVRRGNTVQRRMQMTFCSFTCFCWSSSAFKAACTKCLTPIEEEYHQATLAFFSRVFLSLTGWILWLITEILTPSLLNPEALSTESGSGVTDLSTSTRFSNLLFQPIYTVVLVSRDGRGDGLRLKRGERLYSDVTSPVMSEAMPGKHWVPTPSQTDTVRLPNNIHIFTNDPTC